MNRVSAKRSPLEEIDAQFRRPLLNYFKRRVGDHAEAEDLTQQVFLRLLSADSLDRVEQAEGYVFTIAANLLKDRGRRVSRRSGRAGEPITVSIDPNLVAQLTREAVEERSPERVMIGRETLADVLRVLDSLEDRTRDIYILFRLGNMKQREIADLLGIGQSTVEKHVVKATLRLTRCLGRR